MTPENENDIAAAEQQQGVDLSVLRCVMARLWQPNPLTEARLGLEIIDGPYKGVVFAFTSFQALPVRLENGMVPTKFETTIFKRPEGFREDEAWDAFCSEVLMAWLVYIQHQDFRELTRAASAAGIH